MKTMKKAVSLAMTAVLALSCFAGCGNGGDSNGEATLKIGGIGPLTGAAASYGDAVEKGAKLAIEEINAAGGINGAKIEFKMEDDEHDAEKSVNAYNTLKDWGMQILMGTVTSTPCIAVAAEAKNDNMFLLTPSGTAIACVEADNAFRVCFSDPAQGTKSAEYIGQNKLATKIGIIYDSSDAYSAGIADNFKAEAPNQSLEVVASEAFTADSNKDFKVQLQKCKDAGAEMLFLPIYYQEASLILKQANDMEFKPLIFGCDGLDGVLTVKNFDASLAEGMMLLTPLVTDADDEATSKFVNAYKDTYGDEKPIQFAADAYDAIYAIKLAAEEAGITADMSASDISDAMKEAMTKITLEGVTGTITWDESGEPNKEPKAVVVKDGTYTAM